eukprot:1156954-Pelagomonas_calceolata.AAC.6
MTATMRLLRMDKCSQPSQSQSTRTGCQKSGAPSKASRAVLRLTPSAAFPARARAGGLRFQKIGTPFKTRSECTPYCLAPLFTSVTVQIMLRKQFVIKAKILLHGTSIARYRGREG